MFLAYKAITLGFQQDAVDRIISDFTSAQEQANAPMEMEPPMEEMGM